MMLFVIKNKYTIIAAICLLDWGSLFTENCSDSILKEKSVKNSTFKGYSSNLQK